MSVFKFIYKIITCTGMTMYYMYIYNYQRK